MLVCYIIMSVASYMFRPLIVAIFREGFLEGILQRTLKEFTNITWHVLGKRFIVGDRI